jgi:hypothetical protein
MIVKKQGAKKWPTFAETVRGSVWYWLLARAWGVNLVDGEPQGTKDGLGHAISLLGILLVWQGALIAYIQQNPNPQFRVFIVYVIVSLLPLIGMFSVAGVPEVIMFHRRIAWRLSVLAAILVVSLGTSYYQRWLPGMEKGTYPDTGNAYRGFYIDRVVVGTTHNNWTASLRAPANKSWRIQTVKCFKDQARTQEVQQFRRDSAKTTPEQLAGNFPAQLTDPYFFKVELEAIASGPKYEPSKEDVLFELTPLDR